ncbi:MAG: hypothetical protein JKX84_04965 [Flavobacteriales bacterium]|nr:hypothetical protein [Flavobacteriales bacterium]
MKITFTALCLLFLSSPLWAQTKLAGNKHFDVYMSEQLKKEKFPYSMVTGGSPFTFFESERLSFHQADRKKSAYGQYDQKLKRTVYNVVPHNLEEQEMEVVLTEQMGGMIREYINIFNGREKKQTLYWRTLDTKTLVPSKTKTEVLSRSEKNYSRYGFSLYHTYSPNNKRLVIVTEIGDLKDRQHLKFEIFDENLDLLWDTIPAFPYSDGGEFGLSLRGLMESGNNFQINNQGEIFCLGYKSKSSNWKDGTFPYIIQIGKSKITYTKLEVENFKRNETHLLLGTEGQPILCGLYDDDPEDDNPRQNGFFVAYPDMQTGEFNGNYQAFAEGFIKNWWTTDEISNYEKDIAKGEPAGFTLLDLKQVIPNAEGGFTLISQNWIRNIVVIDLASNGNVNWATKIPFAQSGIGNRYMGFGMAQTDDKLYFLFNDHSKNANPDWDMKKIHTFDQFNRKVPHVATIAICDRNDDGHIIRKQAWTPKEVGGIISPLKKCKQIGNSLFVHLADKGSKERMVRIDLK